VQAAGGIYEYKGKITTPDTLTAHFEFDRCPVVWRHRLWGSAEYTPETQNGVFLYGDKQTLFVTDNKCVAIPRGRKAEPTPVEAPPPQDAGVAQMREFLDAVRAGKQPGCTPEEAYRSTATVHLGMIAYESGSRVDWDAAKETTPGNAAAAKLLKREYRAPYKHPYSLKS
jgi:predicted dehydrogenase